MTGLVPALPETLLLHIGHRVDFGAWHLEPSVVAGAFIALSFYTYGAIFLRAKIPAWRAASYFLGVVAIFLALTSPLDTGADRLLSLHMLQHVALTTVGPPLLLLGLTPSLIDPLLRPAPIRRVAALLTHPVFAGTFFIVNMWFWHVPPVYGAALDYLSVHIVMHVAFLASGILFWWPVIQPSTLTGRLGEGARLLYLFATGMPMGLLALLFFASNGVIYDHYETVDRLWGISAKDDQQIAGLVMGALGEAASFTAVTLLFFRFLDHEEAAARAAAPGRIDAL
ncbi:MAG TPA: cytochrome c oxidase assembly protein [Dehalococcoidia bacterium]|nr:cytochrome c oxidase assembly protein [Dehalococcoidia bacterium]